MDENASDSTGKTVAIVSGAVSGRATSGHPLAPLDINVSPSLVTASPATLKDPCDGSGNHPVSDYGDVSDTGNARTQAQNRSEDASDLSAALPLCGSDSTTRDGAEDGVEGDDDDDDDDDNDDDDVSVGSDGTSNGSSDGWDEGEDDGAVGNDEDDDPESTGLSDADEAEDTSGADNVVDNGDGTLTTHSIDWTTNPPRWHGRLIPRMDPKSIPNWISAHFEPYSRITVCGVDGCGGSLGKGGLKNHLYSMGHFNYRRKCSSCRWSTRADNFSGRHRCQ